MNLCRNWAGRWSHRSALSLSRNLEWHPKSSSCCNCTNWNKHDLKEKRNFKILIQTQCQWPFWFFFFFLGKVYGICLGFLAECFETYLYIYIHVIHASGDVIFCPAFWRLGLIYIKKLCQFIRPVFLWPSLRTLVLN